MNFDKLLKIKIKIDNGLSNQYIDETKDNIVFKFDFDYLTRLHDLSLEDADLQYQKLLSSVSDQQK